MTNQEPLWSKLIGPTMRPNLDKILPEPSEKTKEILTEAFKEVWKKHDNMTDDLDNILIRQKDFILQLINTRQYERARACLACVRELWEESDYGYKYKELKQRIVDVRESS